MPESLSLDFVPPHALSTALSFLLDVVLLGLALGGLLVGLWLHARRLQRAKALEHAELQAPADLRAGAQTVVTGVIEAPGEDGAPVRVVATEQRGAALDRWIETSLRVSARPFELDAGGTRIHVEADDRARVATALVPGPVVPPGRRESTSELRHGTRIYAYGALARERQTFAGYRGGGEGWTLRAPRRGRLLLVTESLDSRYDARIRVLRRFVAGALPLWLAFHAYVTAPLLVASFGGLQTSTRMVSVEERLPTKTDKLAHGYVLTTETGDGFTLETQVGADTAHALATSGVKLVPLLRTGSWARGSFVGGAPWVSAAPVFFALSVVLFALATVRQSYARATPWYDRTSPRPRRQ